MHGSVKLFLDVGKRCNSVIDWNSEKMDKYRNNVYLMLEKKRTE